MPPIISIVGVAHSGKTTLLEKLIPELKQRGHKIGAIKHASHVIEMDKKGKDSWRHKAAGADTVAVVGPGRIALVKDNGCDSLDSLALYFQDMDLVLTEGYKREARPKIEVHRKATGKPPIFPGHPDLAAFVTDMDMELDVPVFGLEDVLALADFIEKRFVKNP